jgi:hypothetical protein
VLDFSPLSQIFVALFAVSTLLQQASIQLFMQPIADSLSQFATAIVQILPKIIPALILVGIGLLGFKVID